ncbi:hypothetical protein VTO42DRAFT_7523 [Malbranchea cinnamomea]
MCLKFYRTEYGDHSLSSDTEQYDCVRLDGSLAGLGKTFEKFLGLPFAGEETNFDSYQQPLLRRLGVTITPEPPTSEINSFCLISSLPRPPPPGVTRTQTTSQTDGEGASCAVQPSPAPAAPGRLWVCCCLSRRSTPLPPPVWPALSLSPSLSHSSTTASQTDRPTIFFVFAFRFTHTRSNFSSLAASFSHLPHPFRL